MQNKALRTFFAPVAFLMLQGCQSMPERGDCMDHDSISLPFIFGVSITKYDDGCAVDKAAMAMMKVDDNLIQAVGIMILQGRHGKIDDATQAIVNAKKQEMDCTVTNIDIQEDGSRRLTIGGCVPITRAP